MKNMLGHRIKGLFTREKSDEMTSPTGSLSALAGPVLDPTTAPKPTLEDVVKKWSRPIAETSVHADIPRLVPKIEIRGTLPSFCHLLANSHLT